jgi:MFS family permease
MATPLMALRAGESAATVGFLLALFALTQVFLALPAGRYADTHGLKRPVALSVGMASFGQRVPPFGQVSLCCALVP